MKQARLDENINSERIEKVCRLEQLVEPLRFPKQWRGQSVKDPRVIHKLLGDGVALVTADDKIVKQHGQYIPNDHPGIVILAIERPSILRMGDGVAMDILRKFKKDFPDWHVVAWNNSIIRITYGTVQVRHVWHGLVSDTTCMFRDRKGWQDELRSVLALNANRSAD